MTSFRPTLIPTLFTIPAMILLLSLGTWQVKRLEWKNQIIADVTRQLAFPAGELPDHVDPEQSQYQRIHVTGEFLHNKEIFLYTGVREFKGKDGYDVLTPLRKADGSLVLVDRGWIPMSAKSPDIRKTWQSPGIVTIEGVIMKKEKKAYFTPDNNPAKNMWFWVDIPAISHYINGPLPDFYILQAEGTDKKQLPLGRTITAASIRNDHLQYAITWYSAALSLLVIYIIYHRKKT